MSLLQWPLLNSLQSDCKIKLLNYGSSRELLNVTLSGLTTLSVKDYLTCNDMANPEVTREEGYPTSISRTTGY